MERLPVESARTAPGPNAGPFPVRLPATARAKVWLAHRLAPSLRWHQDARVGSAALRIPLYGSLGAVHLTNFEPHLDATLRHFLGPPGRGDAFLDVGANLGHHFVKYCAAGATVRYLGVEPNPASAAYVQDLIAANAEIAPKATVACCALAETPGVATLRFDRPFATGAHILADYWPEAAANREQPVPVVRGDDLLRSLGIGPPALIKVDVEGAEWNVLAGLEETLARHGPPILFELLPAEGIARKTPLPAAVVAFRRAQIERLDTLLREHGYGVYRQGPDGSWTPEPSLPNARVERLQDANFLALAPDQAQRLAAAGMARD